MATEELEIPLHGSDETLLVSYSELPTIDATSLFISEKVPLSIWLKAAEYFYSEGDFEKFTQLLQEAGSAFERGIPTGEDPGTTARNAVRVYTSLAGYYLQLAAQTRSKATRTSYLAHVSELTAKADRQGGFDNDTNMLCKAQNYLLRNENLERALEPVEFILGLTPNHIPAILTKACICFKMGKYADALAAYREVMRIKPNAPAAVRVGIGMCFARLGKADKARAAFVRALELDGQQTQALLGLAIVHFNEKTKGSVMEGLRLLTEAFSADKMNALVLTHLADHYFYKKDLKNAHALAFKALENADDDEVEAEACYHLARVFHQQEDYNTAFQYYYRATVLAPSFILPYYGLGQLHMYKSDPATAAECFEKVLQAYPDNYETRKILGSLYAASPDDAKRGEAEKHLGKVVELHPEDVEAWIELAILRERSDYDKALEAYNTALKILATLELPGVPPELSNNIASLHVKRKEYAVAMDMYAQALKDATEMADSIPDEADRAYFAGISVTIRYNIARLHEELHEESKAREIYNAIIREHPKYTDCYLRLGYMDEQHNLPSAVDWYKEALKYNEADANAWTMMGNWHVARSEYGPAQKKFERVIRPDKSDTSKDILDHYALVALGNVYLRDNHPGRAADFFTKVLRLDPSNVFAANGLGCVLASTGKVGEAKDVFIMVRGTGADVHDAWVNLAHAYVELGEYVSAINIYEKCLKLFGMSHDVNLLSALARALFKSGDYVRAKNVLTRALHLNVRDDRHRFNIALCQQRRAATILNMEDHTVNDIKEAIALLSEARSMFQYLKSQGGKLKYDPRRAADEVRRCDDNSAQAMTRLNMSRDREEQLHRVQQEQERKRLALIQQARAREEEEAEQRRLEEETRRAKLEEYKLTVREVEAKKIDVADTKKKEKRKKKEDDFVEEEDEESYDGGDSPGGGEEGGEASERKKDKKREKKKAKKNKRDKEDEGDGEEDGEEAGEAPPSEKKRKGKSRKLKSAEDSEGSDIDGDMAFFSQPTEDQPVEKKKKKLTSGLKSDKSKEYISSDEDEGAGPAEASTAPAEPMEGMEGAATKSKKKNIFDEDD